MAVYMWVCVCLWVYLYHGDLLGAECHSQCTGQGRNIWEDFFSWNWCGQTPRRLRQSSGWSWSSIGHPASDGEWEERQRQKNQWAGEVSLFPWSAWLVSPLFFVKRDYLSRWWSSTNVLRLYSFFAAVFKHRHQNVFSVCVWRGWCFDWASFPPL